MTESSPNKSAAPAPENSETDEVPSGNLFDHPRLTALDPAQPAERQAVERLLESLDDGSR